jgi:hypothetical protein
MKALLHLLRTHWRLVVLVLIVLLLLPAVVAALMAAEDAPEPAATPVEEVSEPAIEPAAPPSAAEPGGGPAPFTEYQEMIERPLFSSTRRPPLLRDAPQENLDAQQLREAWRLNGIVMQQGRQLASFSERQGEQRLLLEQGMVLADEWRLEQIGSDHALLSNGTNEVYLPLREPVVSEAPEPGATPAGKKKPQKKQGKPEKPAQSAAPTDQTTPPAETPAPAAPAQ